MGLTPRPNATAATITTPTPPTPIADITSAASPPSFSVVDSSEHHGCCPYARGSPFNYMDSPRRLDGKKGFSMLLTVSPNLFGDVRENNPPLADELCKLSGPAPLKFLRLYWRERDEFRESLYSQTTFGDDNCGNGYAWVMCGVGITFLFVIFALGRYWAWSHTVDGERVWNTDSKLEDREEIGRYFEVRCICGRPLD
jgi:hypothetical protein